MLSKSSFQLLPYPTSPPSLSSEPLTLHTTTSWSHAGALLNPSSLPPGFHSWSASTVKSGNLLELLVPFLEFLNTWLEEAQMTHYLLTIRAQKPTTEFERPRWHVDRRFFEPLASLSSSQTSLSLEKDAYFEKENRREPSVHKLATALLGPGTLFLENSARGIALQREIEKSLKLEQKKKGHYAVDEEHVCKTLRCLGCAEMADAVRVKLAERVEMEGLSVVQMRRGECGVFRADGEAGSGQGKAEGKVVAAMHSEPPMSEGDRVFVHVVPGTEVEVRRLVEGWGMEFPRDWSVGILVNWGDEGRS